MTPEDIKKLLLPLAKMIAELKAAENAKLRLLVELHAAGFVSEAAASILGHYERYCDEEQEAVLLELEKIFPALAAELDVGRSEPRPLPREDSPDQ